MTFYHDRWSVTLDVTIVLIWGCHEQCSYTLANLINKYCGALTALPSRCSHHTHTHTHTHTHLPFLRHPYSLSYNSVEIRPVDNPTMVSQGSSGRKSCTSLIKNKNQKCLSLVKKPCWKSRSAKRKISHAEELTKLWMQRKSSWGKLRELLQWTQGWWEKETP